MNYLKKIHDFLFNRKTICGKEWINESMSEKYGSDWLERCLDGLKKQSVREELKDILKLKKSDYL